MRQLQIFRAGMLCAAMLAVSAMPAVFAGPVLAESEGAGAPLGQALTDGKGVPKAVIPVEKAQRNAEGPVAAIDRGLEGVAGACISMLRGLLSDPGTAPAQDDSRLSTLVDAAVLFAQNGQSEACEETVAGIRVFAERQGRPAGDQVSGRAGGAAPAGRADTFAAGRPWRIGDLVGRNVIAADGNDLGDIDDVVVMGQARFALIGTGGLLGINESYVPVRVERLEPAGDARFMLPVEEQRFEDARSYSAEQVRDPQVIAAWREADSGFLKMPPRAAH